MDINGDKQGVININVFDTKIKWFVGYFENFNEKYKLSDCNIENKYLGLSFRHNGFYFIYSNGTDIYNTIPHEVVHAIAMMSNDRGILFDGTNHEMIAYLVGYITGNILDKCTNK